MSKAYANERYVDKAFEHIRAENPKSRYYGGGFSAIFGATSAITGWQYKNDADVSQGESLVGTLLLIVGSYRVWDGTKTVLFKTPVEQYAHDFAQSKNDSNPQELTSILHQGQSRARYQRYLRASLISITSASYLYLSSFKRDDYQAQLQTGIFLVGVSAFKWLYPAPAETAVAKYLSSHRMTLNYQLNLVQQQVSMSLNVSF